MPCIYIYIRPPPLTSGLYIKDLNCDLLLREFCAAFTYLNARQTYYAFRPSIPSFPAVERVITSSTSWGDSLTFDDDAV